MSQEVSVSTTNNGTFQVTDLQKKNFLELHALTTEQSENIKIMGKKGNMIDKLRAQKDTQAKIA